MRKKTFSIIGLSVVVLLAGGLGLAWGLGYFDKDVHDAQVGTKTTSETKTADLSEALTLAKAAQVKLNQMQGYRCIYLRDELIDNELQKNYLKLTIHHEPFSVLMEWLEPKIKSGRKAIYVAGKNDNKMLVKQLFVKKTLDPSESITLKESRHTILEAGLKNMVDRFVKSWEVESKLEETTTSYSDVTVEVEVSGKKHSYDCRCVTTEHPLSVKGKYQFYRTTLYFDKAKGLPVRMEGHDWPTPTTPEGRLAERYTYIEVEPTTVPNPKEFQL